MKKISILLLIILCFRFASGQWVKTSFPDSLSVFSVLVTDSMILAGASDEQIHRSSDGGQSWEPIMTGITATAINDLYRYPDTGGTFIFYAATDSGIFRYDMAGNSWTALNTGLTDNMWVSVVRNGTQMVAGGAGKIAYSTDTGGTWTQSPLGSPGQLIRTLLADSSRIFAGAHGPGTRLFRTDDGGQSWTPSDSGVGEVDDLARLGDRYFAATYPALYESNDQGATWHSWFSGLPGTYPIPEIAAFGNHLFIAAFSGIYILHKDSTLVQPVGANLPSLGNYFSIDVSADLAAIGTQGIWVRPTSEIIGVPSGISGDLSEFAEIGLFPNPASDVVFLRIRPLGSLPFQSVSQPELQVFNARGERVYAGNLKSGETAIDVGEWPSGLYYLDLRNRAGRAYGKLVIRH